MRDITKTQSESLADLARNVGRVADAITPFVSAPGRDASGAYVASLTEAVMGMTGALIEIASSIREVAEAVRDSSFNAE